MRRPVRVLVAVVAAAVVVYVLFTVVFPWVDRTFVNDPVLDAADPRAVSATAPPGLLDGVGGDAAGPGRVWG